MTNQTNRLRSEIEIRRLFADVQHTQGQFWHAVRNLERAIGRNIDDTSVDFCIYENVSELPDDIFE